MIILFRRTSFVDTLPRVVLVLLCAGLLLYGHLIFDHSIQAQSTLTKDWQVDDISGISIRTVSNSIALERRDIYILLDKSYFQKEILYRVFSHLSKKHPEPIWLTIEAFSDPEDLRIAIIVNRLDSIHMNLTTLTAEEKKYFKLPSDLTGLPGGFHAYFHRDAEREFMDYLTSPKDWKYDRVVFRDTKIKEDKDDEKMPFERSEDINAVDKYGWTRLLTYLKLDLFDSARSLIMLGAGINQCSPEGICPLAIAAEKGHTEIVALLISKGANVNSKDDGGNTALMRAVGGGFLGAAKLLLEHDADVNAKDSLSITVLMKAWDPPGKVSMTEMLLRAGADINAIDYEGGTALMYAVRAGRLETVKVLLKSGAMAKTKNNLGKTAIDYAKIAGSAGDKNAKALLSALQKASK